ncbi:hypothetical protein K435DRAFT_797306 [Dendrothele bispora CBS 962.96]|uniref:Uncharacterized protein n=1 Tax=Dendrothele bispora (strain CBS 962.96) TaxID=1314807 RepID=A0A4S8M2Y6_DENBC|nr:hypothetical protein K435DRAFT_797306 [Dendrothele bispora CBS 962.96]
MLVIGNEDEVSFTVSAGARHVVVWISSLFWRERAVKGLIEVITKKDGRIIRAMGKDERRESHFNVAYAFFGFCVPVQPLSTAADLRLSLELKYNRLKMTKGLHRVGKVDQDSCALSFNERRLSAEGEGSATSRGSLGRALLRLAVTRLLVLSSSQLVDRGDNWRVQSSSSSLVASATLVLLQPVANHC